MNTRVDRSLIIKLIVFAAVVLLGIWIMNNTYWAEESVPKGLSGEAATNPFYTAQHLSDALGAHSEWKRVLTEMPDTNAVIVLGYWNWNVITERRETLQKWVTAGGRLIIDDSLIAKESALKDWAGLEYQSVSKKSDQEATDEDADEEETAPPKPFLKPGVFCEHLQLTGNNIPVDLRSATYQFCTFDRDRFIASSKPVEWGLRNEHGLQAVRVTIGKGSVSLFNAEPFGNRAMLNGDHGLIFVAATQLQRDDNIFFVMDEDGTPLLKLIWLYGAPAVTLVLLLVAATLWRNGTRFGPMAAVRDGARRSLAEQIIGTGRFIIRFNGGKTLHAATVRALLESARRHIPHYDRLGTQDRIAALAVATNINVDELNSAIHHQGIRRPTDLRHVITVLEHARRILDSKRPNKE